MTCEQSLERKDVHRDFEKIHDRLTDHKIVLQIAVHLIDFNVVFVRTPDWIIE